MKAMILAAGRGTRMKDLTKFTPKPLLDVGGKPMMEHVLEACILAGCKEFAIVVGFCKERLMDYFGDGSRWGVTIKYFVQEVQDGTGHCPLLAREFIGNDNFILCYGDIITVPSNYPKMAEQFLANPQATMQMAVNEVEDPTRGAAVYIEDGKVARIIEKPKPGTSTTRLNNSGIYFFRPSIFPYLEKIQLSQRGEYELPDAFTMILNDKGTILPFYIQNFWFDVGTPEFLDRTVAMVKAEGFSGKSKGPAVLR